MAQGKVFQPISIKMGWILVHSLPAQVTLTNGYVEWYEMVRIVWRFACCWWCHPRLVRYSSICINPPPATVTACREKRFFWLIFVWSVLMYCFAYLLRHLSSDWWRQLLQRAAFWPFVNRTRWLQDWLWQFNFAALLACTHRAVFRATIWAPGFRLIPILAGHVAFCVVGDGYWFCRLLFVYWCDTINILLHHGMVDHYYKCPALLRRSPVYIRTKAAHGQFICGWKLTIFFGVLLSGSVILFIMLPATLGLL